MKRNVLILLISLLAIQAQALIVNVEGYGEVPESGMEITVTEAEMDPLSGAMVMGINGTVLSNGTLVVKIVRSSSGMVDEFCCAGKCAAGNGETTQFLFYEPSGVSEWYAHFYPATEGTETIRYEINDETSSRTITVHYTYTPQGIESVQPSAGSFQKILRNGIIYITNETKTYTIL